MTLADITVHKHFRCYDLWLGHCERIIYEPAAETCMAHSSSKGRFNNYNEAEVSAHLCFSAWGLFTNPVPLIYKQIQSLS